MRAESTLDKSGDLYLEKFKSNFYGMLYWPDLDALWQTLGKKTNQHPSTQWYIYDLTEQPPATTVNGSELQAFVRDIDQWLRETHHEKYCGVVYADDKDNPSFIKIFHPKRMGHGVCSIAKEAPLPGWVISTLKPTDLNQSPAASSSWWKKFTLISNQI